MSTPPARARRRPTRAPAMRTRVCANYTGCLKWFRPTGGRGGSARGGSGGDAPWSPKMVTPGSASVGGAAIHCSTESYEGVLEVGRRDVDLQLERPSPRTPPARRRSARASRTGCNQPLVAARALGAEDSGTPAPLRSGPWAGGAACTPAARTSPRAGRAPAPSSAASAPPSRTASAPARTVGPKVKRADFLGGRGIPHAPWSCVELILHELVPDVTS